MVAREARRVADLVRASASKALNSILERTLDTLLGMLPLAADTDAVAEELARRGILNPTDEDILDVLDSMADTIDLDAAYRRAPMGVRALIDGAFIAVKRLAKPEWVERLTYEEALRVARERGKQRLAAMLERWPNLSRKVIDWVRAKLSG